jgi:hypothetical protein
LISYDVCGKTHGEINLKSGIQGIGFPTTTMHPFTLLCFSVHEFLARNNMIVISHPPYAPDFVLCNFFLYLKFKTALEGKRFNDIPTIQAKSWYAPDEFQTTDSKKCFEHWDGHCSQCIKSQGDYFEWDNTVYRVSMLWRNKFSPETIRVHLTQYAHSSRIVVKYCVK